MPNTRIKKAAAVLREMFDLDVKEDTLTIEKAMAYVETVYSYSETKSTQDKLKQVAAHIRSIADNEYEYVALLLTIGDLTRDCTEDILSSLIDMDDMEVLRDLEVFRQSIITGIIRPDGNENS